MWQHNKIHKQIKAYSHLYVHMLTDDFENNALEYRYCTFEMSSVCVVPGLENDVFISVVSVTCPVKLTDLKSA